MAKEFYTPKNNISPNGGYQRSDNIREYVLTRKEAADIIANLTKMLVLPGSHSVTFSVDDKGVTICRVYFSLVDKEHDDSLKY